MLRHIVLFTYKDTCTDAEIAKLYQELDEISSKLPGRISYSWGKYSSHEGRNKGYTHALITDFVDAHARNLFLDDPIRVAFSKQEALPKLVNGVDSIVSFDFEWN